MIDVIVTNLSQEARDILSFELAREDGALLPAFGAGAHIDVHLPIGLVRQYSLCNHPEERHRYQIAVLQDPQSRGGSEWIHADLKPGDRLRISEPRNLFPLTHEAERSLLFAGGIGVTPILCMAERLAHIGAEFELHYCARSREQAAFVERLRQSPFSQRVHLHFDDGAPEQRADISALLADPGVNQHLYVCGPTGFMDFVLGTARDRGWTENRMHREYFAAAPQSSEDNASFEIQLASTGQVLRIAPEQSVVEALAAAGVEVPVSCEQGVCGTCLTRVLEGEPEHRDMFLTEAEQMANDQFTPCCSRAKSARLVLDL
ncbi:Vanillate O-demethylase oxidoreductase [Pseudomonas sp. TTU2014-066ASC]|nr:Vanillate O-demethylase oxidoreductase [Pseudomonas sp. TTU2014-066ASC]